MTNKRYMTNPATERRIINGALWLLAACVFLAIVAGCSPYGFSNVGTATPTAAPMVTATNQGNNVVTLIPTPRPSCVVTGATVYMRAGAGMRYAPVIVLRGGDELQILKRGAWLMVLTGNRAGYIHGRYCQEMNP
jgi:hypothetical protein